MAQGRDLNWNCLEEFGKSGFIAPWQQPALDRFGAHAAVRVFDMIISASRRTDIPAFYAEWFIRRVRAGYCEVVNPMNPPQVARISLLPGAVDVIVFWTRSPRALMRKLPELDARGFRYYFQFSLLGYPKELEWRCPPENVAVESFRRLSNLVGKEKVIWRYDPIVLSEITEVDYHLHNFETLAGRLHGSTVRCVISVWDEYRKLSKRLKALEERRIRLRQPRREELDRLIPHMVQVAAAHGMEVVTCAEKLDLVRYAGVSRGKCVDDDLIRRVFNLEVCHRKDPSQRPVCGCVQSRDIGMIGSEDLKVVTKRAPSEQEINDLILGPREHDLMWRALKEPVAPKKMSLSRSSTRRSRKQSPTS